MQRPTAEPRIPASASGVSTQRSGPKRSRRPAVARKTPPARPTSSPITSTSGSRSSSTWKASLTASTRVSSATEDPLQLREVGLVRRRRFDVGVLEDESGVGGGLRLGGGGPRGHQGGRLGLGGGDPGAHQVGRFGTHGLGGFVGEQAQPLEVALVAAEALVLPLLLAALQGDVRGRG